MGRAIRDNYSFMRDFVRVEIANRNRWVATQVIVGCKVLFILRINTALLIENDHSLGHPFMTSTQRGSGSGGCMWTG